MKMLLMIPTFNERENLPDLVAEIVRTAPQLDLLIIDDDSPDGTGGLADDLARTHPHVRVIHRPLKSGRGTASVRGYQDAIENGYTHYMEMDSDHSHSPRELPLFLSAIADADVVIGSRFLDGSMIGGWSLYRKALHGAADLSIRMLLGLKITDPTNGYHCYSVEMLKRVDFGRLRSEGYVAHTILKALVNKAGYRIKEIPSVFVSRQCGTSKMNVAEAFSGVRDMISYRLVCLWRGYKYYLK